MKPTRNTRKNQNSPHLAHPESRTKKIFSKEKQELGLLGREGLVDLSHLVETA